MVGDLYDFHVSPVRRGAGKSQSTTGQDSFILAVELVAMAVPLADFGFSVRLDRLAVLLELAGPRAQTHGTAQLVDAAQLAQLVNDSVRSGGVLFAGVGPSPGPHGVRAFHTSAPRA